MDLGLGTCGASHRGTDLGRTPWLTQGITSQQGLREQKEETRNTPSGPHRSVRRCIMNTEYDTLQIRTYQQSRRRAIDIRPITLFWEGCKKVFLLGWKAEGSSSL